MISLGDGPFRSKECRDIILSELRLAGVTNITVEEKEDEVLDPHCEAGVLASHGITMSGTEKRFLKETRFDVSAKFSCKYEIHVGANYW